MKPRLGALSTAGMFPLCPSFDTPGPMARTVADCALAYSVLAGAPSPSPGAHGVRAGVLSALPPLAPDAPAPTLDDRASELAALAEAIGMHSDDVALPVPSAQPVAGLLRRGGGLSP